MAIQVSNVSTNQSFGTWFSKTNQLAYIISTNTVTADATIGGSVTTGNVSINGSLGATTLSATNLKGSNGSLGNTQTLAILSNVTINSTAYAGNSSANTLVGFNPSTNSSYSSNGNINSYLQTVIQNANGGVNATVDLIINADNATDTSNYLDIGINSSGYSNSSFSINGALDAYMYSANGSLAIGTASAKPLHFFANGTLSTNEVMRIDAGANVGIGNTAPNAKLQVTGTANISGNVTFSSNVTVAGNVNLGNTSVNTVITAGAVSVNGLVLTTNSYLTTNYTTNATVYSTFTQNSALTTSNYTFTGIHTHNANVVLTTPLIANGDAGSSGQVLVSNGTTGAPYWLTLTGVNTATQYVWSNTQTFQNTITFSSLANVSSLNVVNQTNTATFFATTSANVGSNVQVNTSTVFIGNTIGNTTIRAGTIAVTNVVGNVIVANSSGVTISSNLTTNTTTILGYANVANNMGVTGTLTVGGDLSVGGNLTYVGVSTASIIPGANMTYTLGNTAYRWSTLYAGGGDFVNNVSVGTDLTVANTITVNNIGQFISSIYSVPAQAVPNTNIQTMDYYDASIYRSAEYTIQVAANTAPGVTNYHTTKLLVMHDGVSAYTTEYGSLLTGSSLASFSADIGTVGVLTGQVRLRVAPTNTNVFITYVRTAITV